MPIDTFLWATDIFKLDEMKDVDELIDSHLFQNSDGYSSMDLTTFDSIENVTLFFNYLFGDRENLNEIFKDDQVEIFDLTDRKKEISTFEKLENCYEDWILESKRENSMDEYGQFIGAISYIQRHQQKKHLFAIIKEF